MGAGAKLAAAATVALVAAGASHGALSGIGASFAAGATASSANERLGMRMAAAAGWTGGEWTCLDELWTRESGWDNLIRNPSSGAWGIAQALGHGNDGSARVVALARFPGGATAHGVTVNEYPSPSANAGSARAEIAWGLRYVRSAYGTPCAAWNTETTSGGY